MEFVIKDGLVLQPDFSLKKQDLVVEDGKISGFDSTGVSGYEKINAKGMLVLPGMVNAHVHMALGLARGLGVGIPLTDMFEKILFPVEDALTDKQAYLGALVCGMQFIRTGCTSVNNLGKTWSKPVLKALEKLGLKGTMALALKDVNLATKEKVECKYLKENEELVKTLKRHPRLKGLFGIANEIEASQSLIGEIKLLASRYNTGIHLHVAESVVEKGFIMQRTGKSSVRYLYDLGVLTDKTIAVHAVNVSANDIRTLARSRALVVHCPSANTALGVGIAPVKEMLDHGVKLGIGVDDPVATVNNNILRELYTAWVLQRTRGFDLPVETLFKTVVGENSLSVGTSADLMIAELEKPIVKTLQQFVMGATKIKHVLIDGEPVLIDGVFARINEEKVLEQAEKESEKLLDSVKLA